MKNLIVYAAAFFSLLSCDSNVVFDDSIISDNLQTKSLEDVGVEKSEFLYRGTSYLSTYQFTEDSVCVFLDENTQNVINVLKEKPNLVTFVYPSGVIEYFDDTVDLDNRLNLAQVYEPIRNLTRTDFLTTRSGHLIVYKDSKCKGKELHSNLDDRVHFVDTGFDYLVSQGMDDGISSIDLTCTSVVNDPYPTNHGNRCTATFFEDPYYKGYSIYFYIDPYTPHSYIHYFRSYPLYPGSSKSWNDRVSSYRFFYN